MSRILFKPFKIRNLELKNRIVMAPMATHFASPEGRVTERLKNYYAKRAKGGVAMIVSESCYVHPEGRGGSNRLSICEDEAILGLKELASVVHADGAKIAAQLHHGGRQISPTSISQYPVSASSLPCIGWGVRALPRTLKIREIEELIEAFSEAARRAKDAGFDAVQILAGHGYLIWSFLSPAGNKRTDDYGGSFENRMRFLIEIIERSREKIGDLPIMVRLNGKDYLCGGLDLKDSTEIARRLEEVGVDAINVSAGTRESHEFQVQPRALAEGYNAYLSHAIKKVVGIPVSIAGGIRTPRIAEEILEKGKADFLDVGRALICDPEWALKIAEERVEDIRPCIACIRCDERLFSNIDVACTVNASMGKEDDYKIDSAPVRKKVLIVGGGPAGLEAARIAALRGHDVTLYEKDPQLGGQLRLAAVPPYKTEFQELIDYFEGQLKKLGVKIELQRGATLEEVVRFGPDVVIVAAGSAPLLPEIPGIELRNVINIYDALADPSKVGKRVVVWGSGLVAGEIADAFSENGREVTIITRRSVRMDIDNSNARLLLERLSGKGVRIFINTNVERITEDSVIIERGGKREAIGIDSFVVAHGAKSETGLLEQLKGRVSELYAVGDCVQPREAFEAIQEGFCAARNI